MDKKREKEIMDQLFDEMKQGDIRTYSEMQQRKSELMNKSSSSKTAADVKSVKKLVPKIMLFVVAFVLVLFAIHFFSDLRMPATQTTYNGLVQKMILFRRTHQQRVFLLPRCGKSGTLHPWPITRLLQRLKVNIKYSFFKMMLPN